MKKLSLGLALALLMLTTFSYAQSGNPTDNPTPASSAVSTLESNSLPRPDNDAPSLFTADCIYLQRVNNNQWDLTCTDPRITPSSSVFASISQYNPGTGRRVLGAATMVVENIVPMNGQVTVRVDVITGSPIYPWMTLLVNP